MGTTVGPGQGKYLLEIHVPITFMCYLATMPNIMYNLNRTSIV